MQTDMKVDPSHSEIDKTKATAPTDSLSSVTQGISLRLYFVGEKFGVTRKPIVPEIL